MQNGLEWAGGELVVVGVVVLHGQAAREALSVGILAGFFLRCHFRNGASSKHAIAARPT
jgi:hypothetical protein